MNSNTNMDVLDLVDTTSFWEDQPYEYSVIEDAAKRIQKGVQGFTVAREMGLERSRMLYWVGQYKQGREW